MNIRNSFAILSYLFRMSANKLSYEEFTEEMRKNYEKHTIDYRVTRELWTV